MANRTVQVTGAIVGETDDAFRFDDGDREVWLPKSLCEWDQDSGEMTLPEWLALEEELI